MAGEPVGDDSQEALLPGGGTPEAADPHRSRLRRLRGSLAALALLATSAAGQLREDAGAADAPRLARTRPPAAGAQHTLLTIPRFGRFAVTVESAQGTGLQLVDRMAGATGMAGSPGGADGRLDLFLDRGEYRLTTLGHKDATGEVRLAVHEFSERSPAEGIQLMEWKPLTTELGDFEQRSFWLAVEERRPVAIEAAGRNLADLRLWQDGAWLVDATPECRPIEPLTGRPLLLCQLASELPPGLYRLTAYGGRPQPWSEESAERPLHLRFGIPRAPEAARRRLAVSPFGCDRFLVPGGATYLRLELPEPGAAVLETGWFDPARPFAAEWGRAEISKQSLPPVAELRPENEPDRLHLVTVTAPPGQPYLLQHFSAARSHSFRRSGRYWIGSVHAGHAGDAVDATALLVARRRRAPKPELVAAEVIELGTGAGWARRANLLEPVTVFLWVRDTGKYGIHSRGTAARFRIEPWLLDRPEGYEPPAFLGSGSQWDLESGYHVLTIEPIDKGIVEVELRPQAWLDPVLEAVGFSGAAAPLPVAASTRFPATTLDLGTEYTLYLNEQGGSEAGLVLRPLPLDLAEPLPLTQRPGEGLEVPFAAGERGRLTARAEDGSLLELSVDGGEWMREAWVEPGEHRARVRWEGGETVVYSLGLEPASRLADTPLPPLPAEALARLPQFPHLRLGEPQRFDLEREEPRTFLVRADEPGLYRLETTGLLATGGNLRTRVVTSLERQAENGVGRNFLVQRYLREGDYQVTVQARGKSRGHLGLALARTALADGGTLALGLPARGATGVGEAVAYRCEIAETGRYRLRAWGLGRSFRARLEDALGWPLDAPEQDADLTADLLPGEYRFIVLPGSVPARHLALLERIPEPPRLAGHGPHPLPLSQEVEHRWLEPEGPGFRESDRWRFSLPAPAEVALTLTDEMEGDLVRLARGEGTEPAEKAAYLPPGRGWSGRLVAGDYELAARCGRVNNRVDYRLGAWPRELLAGQSRQVEAPAEVPLAVGGEALVELSSLGALDVKARLYDGEGQLLGASDDRPGDWNFLLVQRLAAGDYRLRVDPVGRPRAGVEVAMRVLDERQEEGLALPARRELRLDGGVRLFPLALPAGADFLAVAARSRETVGLSLEAAGAGAWRTVASRVGRAVGLELPLPASAAGSREAYRLRLWSADRRGEPVVLSAVAGQAQRVGEAALARGIDLRPVAGLEPAAAVVAVEVERPGCFALPAGAGLKASAAPGEAARGAGRVVGTSGDTLWLAADLGAGRPRRLAAQRLVLEAVRERPVVLDLPAGERLTCDVRPGSGPLLVRAEAVAGQPALAVWDRASEEAPTGLDRRLAVARRAALAATLSAQAPAVALWTAGAEAPQVRLQAWAFPDRDDEAAPWGAIEGELQGVGWRLFELPAGPKRLRLALGPQVAAVLATRSRPASVHWSAEANLEETLETEATHLALFRLASGASLFRFETLPVGSGRLAAPAPDRPFERRTVAAGTLRLALPAPPVDTGPADGLRLHVRGALATLVGADGQVVRGADLSWPAGGGTLQLQQRPGFVVAWVDREGGEAGGPWSGEAAPARRVAPPAVVPLSGRALALEVEAPAPSLLALRAPTPVAVAIERPGRPPRVELHPEGAGVAVALPGGPVRLLLRALGDGELAGTAEVSLAAVLPLAEGLGPPVLLGAGETRLFSFAVRRPGPVGLGVKAEADVVEAALLDGEGEPLGRGVVQLHDLPAGSYFLALSLPADASPVAARPALVGIEPPATGPPAAVVRRYLALELGLPVPTDEPPASVPSEEAESWEDEEEGGGDEHAESGGPGR